ncbi:DNA-binding protein Alba, partial [Candidatus Bathyarchaeota archaeon]|nr:DNA-binding protein Alba [Candidatus Bathyarchaeota archaeon]
MSEEAIIYIGNKPPMRYVTAMITAYNQQGVDSITLKARGRTISRAVDVAEITRNRFITELETPIIAIDTEQLPGMDGGTRGVSSIAIS